MMALCPEDASKVRLGPLSDYTIETLRLLRETLGVVFKIRADAADRRRQAKAALKKRQPADTVTKASASASGDGDTDQNPTASAALDLSRTVLLSCMGIGFRNMSKKVT